MQQRTITYILLGKNERGTKVEAEEVLFTIG